MKQSSTPVSADTTLILARCVCHRFVALALADPRYGGYSELADPANWEIVSSAAELIRDEDAAVARPLAAGEYPLAKLDPAAIFARLPRSAEELNDLYEMNFGLLGGSKCPPYETEYVPSKFTFQRSNLLADIAGFYKAFALQSSSTHPDRPDHVVLECEFLGQLLYLQQQALQRQDVDSQEQIQTCHDAAIRFLKEHMVWWLPAFARLLASQDPGGFYEAVAHFLSALMAAERALAGIEPPRHAAEPASIEKPDECTGCELAIH